MTKIVITFAGATPEREFSWDPAESCEWYDARSMGAGGLAIFHCADPAGGHYSERMIEAYAPGQWRKVVRS